MSAPPDPPPQPTQGFWSNLLRQYVGPTVVASLIGSAISIYSAVNVHNKELRDYGTEFERSLTADKIMNAFKGYDVSEERAAAELLALQSLAVTSEQKQSVLLIGAKLLNANTDTEATGQAAARLLTILIDEDEKTGDRQLIGLTKSDSFLGLVTAGYSNDYYNDNYKGPNYLWTTLNGDQPITHDAKLELLLRLTPEKYDGWIHVETLATSYLFDRQNPHAVTATNAAPAITQQTAQDFLGAIEEVSRGTSTTLSHAGSILSEYVILPPNAAESKDSQASSVDAKELLAGPSSVKTLLLLKARLLRDRPPVEYVNPDGTFFRGSLGNVVGVVPPGACIELVEPAQPILAFVESEVVNLPNSQKHKWIGLIHLWIHVRPSNSCGAF
jgi:hypothetical protein